VCIESDLLLRHFLQRHLSEAARAYMRPRLQRLGAQAAGPMNALSLQADKQSPVLHKRDALGRDLNEIRFHPSYWQMMEMAVESEMLRVKWEPQLRQQFAGEQHSLGFSAFYLFALSELGQHCPLCMTDGAALLLDRYAEPEARERLLAHIYTDQADDFYTGCMFLTEKSGGSDVGRNLVRAEQAEGRSYRLFGEKWFCSNANGQVIFTLARTDTEVSGIRGLSLFLVENQQQDNQGPPFDIVRLKDKLGVRSMASAECIFTGTPARLVGEEFKGFKQMADMVNLSRIHNALASVAGGRRALVEAYQFLKYRETFGKRAIEHALVRSKLAELAAVHAGSFYLLWRTIRAFDRALQGDQKEAARLRLLTPLLKKHTAETAVYLARESMELMGGMGYIEDTVLPKIMRDVLVLPIWEGTSNIQVLDMMRAVHKTGGEALLEMLAPALQAYPELLPDWEDSLAAWQQSAGQGRDQQEVQAKAFFEHLTRLLQIALLLENRDEASQAWVEPAIDVLKGASAPLVPSVEQVEAMLGWELGGV
jgi:acyl-CoA dehydrogenase